MKRIFYIVDHYSLFATLLFILSFHKLFSCLSSLATLFCTTFPTPTPILLTLLFLPDTEVRSKYLLYRNLVMNY